MEIWKADKIVDKEGIPNRGDHEVVLVKDILKLKERLEVLRKKHCQKVIWLEVDPCPNEDDACAVCYEYFIINKEFERI